MKLYDKDGKQVLCKCALLAPRTLKKRERLSLSSSFEPIKGTDDEYQCLVCGEKVEGDFWGE